MTRAADWSAQGPSGRPGGSTAAVGDPGGARRNRDRAYTLERYTEGSEAACLDCEWERYDVGRDGWLAGRAAARRHVARTGHVVHVARRDVTAYAPEPPAPDDAP